MDGIREIEKSLGQMKREAFEMIEENEMTEDLITDFVARLRFVRMEWMFIRKSCSNPFHAFPERRRKNKICPECGIKSFEFIFKLDL